MGDLRETCGRSVQRAVRMAVVAASFLGGASAGGHAQEAEAWKIRLDRPGAGNQPDFVAMAPGWHVTTGPAAIFYAPSKTASGEYRLEAEIFLFDPGERREGFGVLFGGTRLEEQDQAYAYFLIRRDGRFLVKKRQGGATSVLQDWTPHPAIVTWEARGEGESSVKNVLAVEVGSDEVSFRVNGQAVATLSREELPTEGTVGLRVNHGLNLHLTRLDVVPAEQGE